MPRGRPKKIKFKTKTPSKASASKTKRKTSASSTNTSSNSAKSGSRRKRPRTQTHTPPPPSQRETLSTPASVSDVPPELTPARFIGTPSKIVHHDKKTNRRHFITLRDMVIPSECHFSDVQTHYKSKDKPGQATWQVQVGDLVLIKVNEEDTNTSPKKRFRVKKLQPWYPFTCHYAPCQIIALYQEEDDTVGMTVRWFYKVSEVSYSRCTRIGIEDDEKNWKNLNSKGEEVVESDALADGVCPSMLVGRANIVVRPDASIRFSDVISPKDGMPSINYICKRYLYNNEQKYSYILYDDGKCHVDDSFNRTVENLITEQDEFCVFQSRRLARGLQCMEYHAKTMVKMLRHSYEAWNEELEDEKDGDEDNDDNANEISSNALEGEDIVDDNSAEGDGDADDKEPQPGSETSVVEEVRDSAWVSELPFHVDISAQKAFYTSVNIIPPTDEYSEPYAATSQMTEGEELWKVSVGDTVAIHVDLGTKVRKRKRTLSSGIEYHPYKVQWWSANVVAIYRGLEEDEAKDMKDRRPTEAGHGLQKYGQVRLEVRWFYKPEDIPGMTGSNSKAEREARDGLEELFETDDIDEVGAGALLGPVMLHSNRSPKQMETSRKGIPLVHYFCQRLWSIHRKTMMPIGTSGNRMQRGMIYSKYLGRGTAGRSAFEKTKGNGNGSSADEDASNWKIIFRKTISKLTLAEASAVDSGLEVIGREKEKAGIRNFLNSAVRGVNATDMAESSSGSNAFALFIGGPPGTGKTASVNSIVYQMRKDQAEGVIPEFTFLSLNGMEMRHPFDMYVRLWEAVSPNKEKLTRPKALAKLQLYFSDSSSLQNIPSSTVTERKRRAVVLLVDEIDYLVTQKQTILYNLFDWPITGYENNSPAQLIVVGISNTLNLPERLHVRLQSRIGNRRCTFNSYSADDSAKILKGKLGIYSDVKTIFHPDAIRFAARKIASESGDIRKVFQLCKSAAENVFNQLTSGNKSMPNNNVSKIVEVRDVQNAANQMFNSTLHLAVSHASSYQALLFIALAALQRYTGREVGGFLVEEVLTKMESMANSFGSRKYLPCPQYHMILAMMCPLGEAGLLKLTTANGSGNGLCGTNGAETLVSLNMDSYEVLSSLKDTAHYPLAQKFLAQKLFSFK